VSGGSYARQAVTMATTGTPGVIVTTGALTFPNMPAVTVENAALFDAASGGNRLTAITAVTTPKTYLAGDTAVLNAGDVTFTET
jgi:hypothetical protein